MTPERLNELTRRELLARAAGAIVTLGLTGLAGVRATTGEGAPLRAEAREFVLEAREVKWELGPGKPIKAMAYNGRVPGPEIRVKEGERLRVVLKNALA